MTQPTNQRRLPRLPASVPGLQRWPLGVWQTFLVGLSYNVASGAHLLSQMAPESPQGQSQGPSGQNAGPSQNAEVRKSLRDNS